MRVILHEAKKMFIHQKGLLFVCLFLALTAATVILFDSPANADMELYSAEYHHHLESVQGKLTTESEAFLQAEAGSLSAAQIALERIYEDFYDGKLSKREFAEKTIPFEAILQNKKGFDLVYEQYNFVRESSGNRYFLDTNGWNGLLSGESLEFLLFLTLLLLITPVFCHEASSKMDGIILTQKNGAMHTAVCKILLVFGITTLLCVFAFGIRYLFYSSVYGLENGSFPMQSLPYFASSTKNLTLAQAFVYISACKMLGFIAFSMLIMAVSVSVKKYPLSIFFCTAVTLLPYFGLGVGGAKYYLPLPLGFMLGTGFFKGSESTLDPYTGQKITQFTEISSPVFWGLLAVLLALGIVLCVVITRSYLNVWRAKSPWRGIKSMSLLLICALACSLVGCSHYRAGDYDIYNMDDRSNFENENFIFSAQYKDSKPDILFEDKLTGKIQSLILSPMKSMTEIGNEIYGNGKFVYYTTYDIDKSGPKPQLNRFSIIEVDTTSFDETIVLERNINESEDGILGNSHLKLFDNRFLAVYAFFLDSQSVFVVCDSEIMQINRITGTTNLIPITGKGNIAYDGRHLYYINERHQIVKHDTNSNSKVFFESAITEQFYLTNTEILYRNRQDGDKIYSMSLDGEKVYKLSEKSVLSVSGDETYLYFTDKKDLKNYRMDRDGGNIVLIEN